MEAVEVERLEWSSSLIVAGLPCWETSVGMIDCTSRSHSGKGSWYRTSCLDMDRLKASVATKVGCKAFKTFPSQEDIVKQGN